MNKPKGALAAILPEPLYSWLSDTGHKLLGPADGLLGNAEQRKNRGQFQDIRLGGTQKTVVDVLGDDQLACGAAIACSVQSLTGGDDATLPTVVGVLSWGTAGVAVQSVEFDWLRGTVLGVAGSTVQVFARVESAPNEDATECTVGASIAYGAKAFGPAQRTRVLVLPDATPVAVQVPKFARIVRLLRSVAGAAITAEWLDSNGATLAQWNSGGELVLPMPSGATELQVTNASGAALTVRAVFELGF